ncbi:glycosyltransferase family 4 protein [Streptomyces sp. NPDC002285]
MKIAFLIHNVYGIGGTIRTVVNLAAELAGRHEVEIASVFRHRARPRFAVDPRVRLTPLVDTRPGHEAGHPLASTASRLFPASEGRYPQYSRLTDERITAWLASVDADVVIGTRPGLNVMLARYGPRNAIRIGQEHLTLDGHRPALRAQLRRCYPLLDAVVTVTEADAAAYRSQVPSMRVAAIPNSVPQPHVAPSDGTSRVVVAAGRLAPGKRFDLLVDAFAKVAAERPDWQLRIYGQGPCRDTVQARIDYHALHENVLLMGMHASMEAEWAKGAIAAVSSSNESFGMTIVEAMRCGLPVVSTDCPLGPREIIRHGQDGLLVPVGDTEALADALLRLIKDDRTRKQMACFAWEGASRFDPGTIADRHETLFGDLVQVRQALPGHITTARYRLRAARAAVSCTASEYLFKTARRAKHIRGDRTSP